MTRFVGHFDLIREDHAIGWAVDQDRPHDIINVRLCVDGRPVAVARAEEPRSDVLAAGFGHGRGGFFIQIPKQFADGTSHDIGVTFENSDEWLEGGPLSFSKARAPAPDADTPGRFAGNVDKVADGTVNGWAFDPENPAERLLLELRVDGEVVQLATADEERRDVAKAGYGDGFCGFSARLPPQIFDGSPHEIRIGIAGTPNLLTGIHTVCMRRSGMVYLDRAAAAIAGWATQGADLIIRLDDRDSIPVMPRQPVVGFGGQNVASGFVTDIPHEYLDGRWHSASIRFAGTEEELPGSPFEFRLRKPPIRLHLSPAVGRTVTGWAVDPARPKVPVRLYVFVNDSFYGEITASRRRSDGSDSSGRRADGFSFGLPRGARRIVFATAREAGDTIASFDIRDDSRIAVARADGEEFQGATRFEDRSFVETVQRSFVKFLSKPNRRFDAEWYVLAYPEAAHALATGQAKSAIDHYAKHGHRAGYSPNPYFDESWYRHRWSSVGKAVEAGTIPCGFAHYLAVGAASGFDPIPGFDTGDYLQTQPEAAEAVREGQVADPLEFWLRNAYVSSYRTERASTHAAAPVPTRPIQRAPSIVSPDLSKGIYASWMSRLTSAAGAEEHLATLSQSDVLTTNAVLETPLSARPLVSVIMPTFNRAYTIAEAIQSVLDQTYEHWELLVCDDGSTDKTSLVLAQMNDPRIRYMHFEKSNGAETRNKGLSFAQGEYIAYLDSDNLWHPLYLDVMLRALFASPSRPCAYAGYIDTDIIGTKVTINELSAHAFNPVRFSEKNFIDLNTICHHRNLYDWLGGFDNTLPRLQDWDLTLRYFSIFHPIPVPHYLAYYRRNVAWGQVTNLFLDTDINALVKRKTDVRLNQEHTRLEIEWPGRPRLVMLVGPGGGAMLVADLLARRAVASAEVTVIGPGRSGAGTATHAPPGEVLDVALETEAFESPSVLAGATMPFLTPETAVVSIGLSEAMLQGLRERLPMQVDALTLGAEGVCIAAVGSRRPFHLGSLSLPPREGETSREPGSARTNLLLLSRPERAPVSVATVQGWLAAKDLRDIDVIVAPADPLEGAWQVVGPEGAHPWSERGLPAVERALASVRFVGSLTAAEDLHPASFALVTEAMFRRLVVMLPPSPFSTPLIERRAVSGIPNADASVMFDRAQRLTAGLPEVERLLRNAATTYRITFHSELVEERLRFYLHSRCFEEVH